MNEQVPENGLSGEGFSTQDSLQSEFPKIDVEVIRHSMQIALHNIYKGQKFTGVQEEFEFDDHGLLVGKHHRGSFFSLTQLKEVHDIQSFVRKMADGANFDAECTIDEAAKKGTVTFTLKRHPQAPNLKVIPPPKQ